VQNSGAGFVGAVGHERHARLVAPARAAVPDLAVLVEPLLVVRRALREQIVILHRRLLAIVTPNGQLEKQIISERHRTSH
jgi:hypothetical protein